MTTDPTPEQLKALADEFEHDLRFDLPTTRTSVKSAAHHLRAYAEQQAELAKWKLGCETNADCYREAVRAQDSQRLEIIALKDQLFSAKSSIQICVGAAGIGDPDELCGWIDNIKAQHESWRKALEEIEAQVTVESVQYPGRIARQALNPPASSHTPDK